ncbi:MAG: DHH family phosphoesterase [Candidatus Micrarchaeota archaeon]
MRKLLADLKNLRGRTLISFHSLADVDAAASAFALKTLLPTAVVKAPDKPNSAARKLLEEAGQEAPLLEKGELATFDNCVLVDVSSAELMADFGKEFEEFAKRRKLVCIDHHLHTKKIPGAVHHSFTHRASCSEIVFELLVMARKKVPDEAALALAAGIAADTALFSSANSYTFSAFAALLKQLEESKIDYGRVVDLASPAPDISYKLAVAKAMGRANFYEVGKGRERVIIGATQAHSFELYCALALLQAADYAFAFNDREGRLSGARSRHMADGASIGKIMEAAGAAMKGNGGGHDAVGGASGKPELTEKALQECVRLAAAFHGGAAKPVG